MVQNVNISIKQLINYAVNTSLIEEEDRVWAQNGLLALLNLDTYQDPGEVENEPLESILAVLDDYAAENGLIDSNSVVYRDLFDTSLMGVFVSKPSEVIHRFNELYRESPEKATHWFYQYCNDCDYIRSYRICKDKRWVVASEYGDIDITINLSKPEKDPKAIAAAKSMPQTGYPQCLLCHENEGYAGNVKSPARQNLRQIPVRLANDTWYFQYSPYVYYNEHCIVLSDKHEPMKISRDTFVRQLSFVEQFPHYFLGSNADLPIVGGSILTHDHMQGGHYTFAMEKAPIRTQVKFDAFKGISAGIVHWPMSVIRLSSSDKEELIEAADYIQKEWRRYSDDEVGVLAETNGEPHNTVTPIARMRNDKFELDLVLRCNITSEEHPLGVFHPHAELHHIKKENIGLIEVMGLAVLPARLKFEMEKLSAFLLAGKSVDNDEDLSKHAEWVKVLSKTYTFTPDNVNAILEKEIGKVFVKVLEDAGVYKNTPQGRDHFIKFITSIGGSIQ